MTITYYTLMRDQILWYEIILLKMLLKTIQLLRNRKIMNFIQWGKIVSVFSFLEENIAQKQH